MKITVMLTAKAHGTKLKPFVLLNRKRPVKELEEFRGKLVINYAGTTWMNDELRTAYIKEVLGATMFGRRLLIWDSFNCHIDDNAKKELKPRKIDMAVVPGGCTKFVQPADVSWNKPFKDVLRSHYNEWLASGTLEYTKGGNLRPAPLQLICQWIIGAWESVSADLIRKSFNCCGISVALDGSQDSEITVFKDGRGCELGQALLATNAAGAEQELEADELKELKLAQEQSDSEDDTVEGDTEDYDSVDEGPDSSDSDYAE